MSSAQKLIKIVAIAFAALLIVSIISGITIGIMGIASIGNLQDTQEVGIYEEVSRVFETDENLLNLDIDINASKLQVKTGERFVVETNNKYVSCIKEKDKLVVKEKKHSWTMNSSDSIVVIYIPENVKLNSVDIYTGAGTVDVQCIEAEKVYFEFGAGKVDIEKLIAGSAKLETGAGKFTIRDGVLKNADLDLGVGETNITAAFTGKTSVDAGVGRLELNLIGEETDYTVSVSKGVGEVSVFGNEAADKSIIGNGVNEIKLSAGVGKIEVNVK